MTLTGEMCQKLTARKPGFSYRLGELKRYRGNRARCCSGERAGLASPGR